MVHLTELEELADMASAFWLLVGKSAAKPYSLHKYLKGPCLWAEPTKRYLATAFC
jgi:hypothetical protein